MGTTKMLHVLESDNNKVSKQLSLWTMIPEPEVKVVEKESLIDEDLKKVDINSLTPIEALNKLSELKGKL